MPQVRDRDQNQADTQPEEAAPESVLQRLREEARGNSIRQNWERPVKLHDGTWVGSWSMDWRLECEARRLLSIPLEERRKQLAIREDKRGAKAVNALKDRMLSIHKVLQNRQ